jgi:eukaryotic-like serine/threonine-protein kinase
MRICPKCNRRFPDNTLFCPDDHAALTSRVNDSRPVPQGPVELVGRSLFGEYTFTRKLGEGGMGAVYLAQQDSIDQKIAVKVLHANAADSAEIVQRFHREARVISMLTHPNIIRVFIFGRTEDNLLYLAMEYVEGRTLRDAMKAEGMDEVRAIKIMKQLCSGLSEAHDLGIIHRDLKPDNVLLTRFRGEDNFVKILDFGIAKLKEPDGKPEQKLTQAGIVYGTPEYLSPEQAQALDLDQRTDIYSLGVMLYELMTGRVPFTASAPVQILTMHVFNEPKRPSEIAPGKVGPTMERIILKALAKDPAKRYKHALDMFEDLVMREQEILSERGLDPRSTYVPGIEMTGFYRAVSGPNTGQSAAQPQQAPQPKPQPHMQPQAQPAMAYAQNGHGAGRDDFDGAPTMAMGPVPTSNQGFVQPGFSQPQHQTAQVQSAPQFTAATPAQQPAGNDKAVKIMIGVAAFIFLVLVGVIGFLLLNSN